MFIAVHYVRINGTMFAPGETITESIAPEKEARLLDMGAIREAAEAPFPEVQGNAGAVGVGETDAGGGEDEAEGGAEETEVAAEEEYEDAEPMEIDAVESIIPAEEPVPQKKPGRKRKGGKESNA